MEGKIELNQYTTEAEIAYYKAGFGEAIWIMREEQRNLGEFRPWMMHSLCEQSPSVVFRPQLLSDYGAVDELETKNAGRAGS